tara:strand:- start:657 stop:1868 length:1212 start_codon:yes stop_codon:yes gene_type:complete
MNYFTSKDLHREDNDVDQAGAMKHKEIAQQLAIEAAERVLNPSITSAGLEASYNKGLGRVPDPNAKAVRAQLVGYIRREGAHEDVRQAAVNAGYTPEQFDAMVREASGTPSEEDIEGGVRLMVEDALETPAPSASPVFDAELPPASIGSVTGSDANEESISGMGPVLDPTVDSEESLTIGGEPNNRFAEDVLGGSSAMGKRDIESEAPYISWSELPPAIADTRVIRAWGEFYQSENKTASIEHAEDVLKTFDFSTIPSDAVSSMDKAVAMFEGDRGATRIVSGAALKRSLEVFGAIETLYQTKIQGEFGGRKGSPEEVARSYWQVEPETAFDILRGGKEVEGKTNATPLLGRKFREAFGDPAVLLNLTNEQMADKLLNDQDFAAAMAAAKIIMSADSILGESD